MKLTDLIKSKTFIGIVLWVSVFYIYIYNVSQNMP